MMILIIALATAFVAGLLLGELIIPALRAMNAGQSIREVGPKWHMTKQGTPTMGGLIFISAMIIAQLTGYFIRLQNAFLLHGWILIVMTAFSLVCGVIGFMDDYVKVKKRRNLGLTAIQKLALQTAAAVLFIILLRNLGFISSSLYIPFFKFWLSVPWMFYVIFTAVLIVGVVNSANLADGVDGLATGVTMPICLFFAIAGFTRENYTVALFALAMFGALGAFLTFNFNPAKVFMGDTGSLFLGGAVSAMAFALDMPLILIPVCVVYICEALSDIIQVSYFKLSGGKRVFRMAPLHHHFEMGGWKEKKIFAVFTAVSILGCVVGYFGI